MKKYIIKYANGSTCPDIKDEFNSREEAGDFLMRYIRIHNEFLHIGDNNYLLPFDFTLEEVDIKDVNEVITDFESAREAINNSTNFTITFKDVTTLVSEVESTHIEALIALNRLFTIAEAWNKEDGFVSDFSDCEQDKWFPRFRYDDDAAGFVYVDAQYTSTHYTLTNVAAYINSRLCFKTSARAEQFGKQFDDLYNKVFL